MRASLFISSALAVAVLAACGSRGGSPETPAAAPGKPVEPPKPVVSCIARPKPAEAPVKPAPASKSKKPVKAATAKSRTSSSSSSSSSSEAAAATLPAGADGKCPPGYDAVAGAPVSRAASASSSSQASTDGERPSRQVKSDDGSIEGTVFGSPAPGSKLAKVKIGMTEGEVRRAIGEPDDETSYVTGKAFIPFYFGNDSARVEWIYKGAGSVAFNAGGFGGRRVVMMINHEPKIR